MRSMAMAAVVAALVLFTGDANPARAADKLPWAFYGRPAEGYSIKLEAIDPAPGTPLVRGSEVTVSVSVTYQMTVASHGTIVLVTQDENDRPVASHGSPAKQEVDGATGAATLTETLMVPSNAKELRLFVPLIPAGMTNTSGEITVRYPIVKKK